jgi:hypothetical protein
MESIKSEFNKHFEHHKVIHAFPTRAGALIIELSNTTEANTVHNNWKPHMFSRDEHDPTSCKIMETKCAIIKHVPLYISDEDLNKDIHRQFPNATVKRFVTRENKRLLTAIVEFHSLKQFNDAWEEGIRLQNSYFQLEELVQKRRIIRCHKCKEYDHVQKWCPNSYKCGYCTGHHLEEECTSEKYRCVNCDQEHAVDDTRCPTYNRKLSYNVNNQQGRHHE